jgi:DNA oxidative demethylase
MATRYPAAAAPPEGLRYIREFVSAEEERELIALVEPLPFHEVRMRGQVARRTVIHFGWDYDYDGWSIHPADPPPPLLRALADRCAEAAEIAPESLQQFLVARYPPGATIGWHRDAPMFGTPVIGVSLAAPCAMKFRRKLGASYEVYTQLVEPRSLYILGGAARSAWQHSIPPTKGTRYSVTMRTLRIPRSSSGSSGSSE